MDNLTPVQQISSLLNTSLRGGVWTYYEATAYSEQCRTADYLAKEDWQELYKKYKCGMHDYEDPQYAENFDYPEEWISDTYPIDAWIWDNQDAVNDWIARKE